MPKLDDNSGSSLSLPHVKAQTIKQVSKDPIDTLALYKRLFEDDELTALYIREKAIELTPDDLDLREAIIRLALETLELKNTQVLVNGLHERLFVESVTVQEKAKQPDILLPPTI